MAQYLLHNISIKYLLLVSAVTYVVEVGEIIPQMLSPFGYGEPRPLLPNAASTGPALNRRVEFVLATEGEIYHVK